MTLSKDQIRTTLESVPRPDSAGADGSRTIGEAVEWIATCEGAVSVKLHVEGVADAEAFDTIAEAGAAAIRQRAGESGEPLQSLVFEFVDGLGSVIHTRGYGQPSRDAGTGSRESKPAGGAPGGSESGGGGHRPIGGLGQQGAQSGQQSREESGTAGSRAQNPQDTAGALPGVRHAIAIGAGKGGVGKSTVAVNLAIGLARKGHAVGVLDGDIYGPSLPTLLGLGSMEQQVHGGYLQPYLVHGLKAITIGKLVDPEKPLIWRGPMAHGAFKQLTEQTAWGDLDYLIIDLPPGTGDVPLTMAQMLRLTGAVIVCTPQRVAQDDAVRATRMFTQLGVDVLGVVENMSYFIGDDEKEYDIFGRGGAEQMAQRLGVPYLGAVPINMALRHNSDAGDPSANFEPETAGGESLPASWASLATNLENQVALAAMRSGQTRPTLNIS